MPDRVGQQLGNYRLVRLLGTGGFAEVYLGEHVYLKSPAGIKLLHAHLAQEDIASFLSEAQTLVRLIHPHIVRLLDFGVEGNIPFLVMDYAPNGTLRQRHPRGERLSLPTIVDYVKQVAEGLQYAHDEKLIHRDIKPENMLLGRRNEVLLSDFGIAVVAQSSRYDRTQDTTGTISYMAPEQIQAHPRPASDQYALGIVVYEWLSGERPFRGSFTEIAAKHCLTPPPPLREKVSSISGEVEQVVMTALAKDPKQRFGSVRAFATALEQASVAPRRITPVAQVIAPLPIQTSTPTVLATSSSEVYPPPIVTPSPSPSTQPVLSTASSAPSDVVTSASESVIPTALIIPSNRPIQMAVASDQTSPPIEVASLPSQPALQPTLFPSEAPPASKRGISRRTVLIGLAGVAIAGGGLTWLVVAPHPPYTYGGHSSYVQAVVWSPDGTRIASGGGDGTVQVWDAATGGNVYTYRGHSNFVWVVAWSPDGRRIASGSTDNTVQVWDAATGGNVYTYRGHSDFVHAVVWSPDGKRIASGGNDNTVQVWDAATGGNVYTYRGHSYSVQAVVWSPDGRRIASGGSDKTVQVWNAADGGHMYTYRGHSSYVQAVAWSPDGRSIASGGGDKTVQVWVAR